MSVYRERLPYHPLLGRHIEHHEASKRFLVPAKATATFTVVKYTGIAPILNQGNLGACTGYSCTALYSYIEPNLATLPSTPEEWDALAKKVYSVGTQNDEFDGEYPPDDTGSSGIGVAKASQKLGFASGYLHITSPAALAAALETGPVIVGTVWYNSMFDPDANGNIKVNTRSGVAGGHEYVLDEVTADGRFGFRNSWGEDWGVGGRFYMKQKDFLKLLADDGDATQLVPVTEPSPTPSPGPAPGPVVDYSVLVQAYSELGAFLKAAGAL